MAAIGSNTITGVTTVTSADSVVNKDYADNYILTTTYPSTSGIGTGYLFTTGVTTSWAAYEEFSTKVSAGMTEYTAPYNNAVSTYPVNTNPHFNGYRFEIPSNASTFYIEIVGAGGGGSSGVQRGANNLSGRQGAGGGAGSYSRWLIPAVEVGIATEFIIGVGTGGGGGGPIGLSTSSDGLTWNTTQHAALDGTINESDNDANTWQNAVYGNNQFVITNNNGGMQVSSNLIVWALRTTGSGIGNICGAYGNNVYVIGSNSVQLITSTDTISWTFRTNPNGGIFYNTIRFAGSPLNQFLANYQGGLIASTDAVSWTLRTNTNPQQPAALLYDGTQWVQIGSNGTNPISEVSTDSISWVARTGPSTAVGGGALGFNNAYRTLSYGNSVYVVTGNGQANSFDTANSVWNSTDTIVWTLRTLGHPYTTGSLTNQSLRTTFRSSAFGPIGGVNLHVAVGDRNTFMTSTNGITWVLRTHIFPRGGSGVNDVGRIWDIVYGSGIGWLTIGTNRFSGTAGSGSFVRWVPGVDLINGGSYEYFLTSDGGGGASGQNAGSAAGAKGGDSSTIYSVSGTAGVNINGIDAAANPGAPQTYITSPLSQISPYQITAGGLGAFNTETGQSVVAYVGGNLYNNNSGGSASGGNGASGIPDTYRLSYGSGGSGGGAFATGVGSWYMRTSGISVPSPNLGGAAFGASIFVVATANQAAATSTDSITWTLRTYGANSTSNSMTFGTFPSSQFVSVGTSGITCNSTDGITWIIRTQVFGSANTLRVINDGTLYIAGTISRFFSVSTDAVNWTARTTAFGPTGTTDIYGIAYASSLAEKYVIGGASRNISSSTDNISWTVRTAGLSSATDQIQAAAFGNGVYVYGTTNSKVYSSTNGIQWVARSCVFYATLGMYTLKFLNSYFIASTTNRQSIRISTDGITWDHGHYNVASTINDFDYSSTTSTYFGICQNSTVVAAITSNRVAAGSGGKGTKGGGGGGGGYAQSGPLRAFGVGGQGGEGFVRITWW